ncbi:hypothetical protein WOLCODRAFT_146375 [Wolfiporia cocos MD-104 SS10]|uniref:Uncharacterized protein n=1 Tax=Wolfiporia cocos (strain MD-104) TaxID=742152 RepID=A0A2H3JDA4_WOLCO|nr:hypothetical protein WOLCODRAFT_146375 [Wolfiporia cocos MD-104 SS10]
MYLWTSSSQIKEMARTCSDFELTMRSITMIIFSSPYRMTKLSLSANIPVKHRDVRTAQLCPLPLNLLECSLCINFFPYRDGPVDSQWNVSYSDSRFSDWSSNPFGVGMYGHEPTMQKSSHNTTLIGAYALLEWAGTGVWFYGTMRNGEYTIQIDDGIPSSGDGAIDGVLFGQDGLAYGFHKALINVTGNTEMSSITGATITVGMGESGTVRLQRTINATVNSGSLAANPLFVVNDGSEWSAETLYGNQSHPYPCIATSITGSSISFNLNESVGFALYGSDDYQQGLFVVNYSPRSQWTELNQLKFIATGMNQSQTYNVDITNLGANFNLASVVVYSAIPSPGNSKSISANSLASAPLPKPSSALLPVSRSLDTGAIAGAAIGGFVAVLIVAVLVVLAIRRRRRQQEAAALLTVPTISDLLPCGMSQTQRKEVAQSEICGW